MFLLRSYSFNVHAKLMIGDIDHVDIHILE